MQPIALELRFGTRAKKTRLEIKKTLRERIVPHTALETIPEEISKPVVIQKIVKEWTPPSKEEKKRRRAKFIKDYLKVKDRERAIATFNSNIDSFCANIDHNNKDKKILEQNDSECLSTQQNTTTEKKVETSCEEKLSHDENKNQERKTTCDTKMNHDVQQEEEKKQSDETLNPILELKGIGSPSPKQNVKVLSWNINGMRARLKKHNFLDALKKRKCRCMDPPRE